MVTGDRVLLARCPGAGPVELAVADIVLCRGRDTREAALGSSADVLACWPGCGMAATAYGDRHWVARLRDGHVLTVRSRDPLDAGAELAAIAGVYCWWVDRLGR